LVFVDFDFDGTRAHAISQYPNCRIAYTFVFPKRALVFFGDTTSFVDPASVD